MAKIKCDNCERLFDKKPNQIRLTSNHFCSRKCFGEWNSQHRVGTNHPTYNRVNRKCETCGKTFEIIPSEVQKGWGRYCSPKCHYEAGRTECTCRQCNKVFSAPQNQTQNIKGGGSFCSKKCRHEWQSANPPANTPPVMKGANNPRWLGGHSRTRGDNWKTQGEKARKRDKYQCRICKVDEKTLGRKLHIHHKKPYRAFDGDWKKANRLSNLISLCPSCHQRVERGSLSLP